LLRLNTRLTSGNYSHGFLNRFVLLVTSERHFIALEWVRSDAQGVLDLAHSIYARLAVFVEFLANSGYLPNLAVEA
jgi:hypothetical protein